MNNKGLVISGVVLALLFFAVAYIYFTHTAGQLPGFFPGFSAGAGNVHTKHGLAALVLGVGCLVYAWFQSGPKQTI